MTNESYDKLNKINFSVSMCVYKNDNPKHFYLAVESIKNQSYPPKEIVIVVDGPVPSEINDILIKYEPDNVFKIIRLPKNVGHGRARNIGLENCSFDLVALMDADDISVHDRFSKQLSYFHSYEKLSVVGSNISEFIDQIDNVVGIREVPEDDKEIKLFLKRRSPFNQMTVMFKRSDVLNSGGYLDWYQNEDYYLWIRMYLDGAKFKNIKESLVLVRVGKEMYQRRGGWKYFKSEYNLQKFMLKNRIIHFPLFVYNISVRFILQVLMPNTFRGFLFKAFARKSIK